MFNAWKIGRIFGIDIGIHWSFLALFGFLVYSQWAAGAGVAGTALYGLLFLAVFGCVLLHELGHAMAAHQFCIGTRDITLLPIGGVARLERMPEKPLQELWVAVAGPLVNVVIAGLILAGLLTTFRPEEIFSFQWGGLSFFRELMWINVMLVAFNMLPAFPMDGGRVLRALLGFVLSYVDATRVASIVGQALAVLMGLAGLAMGNWMLAILAAFVFLAARAESKGALMREAYRTLPVGRSARRYFFTLRPEMTTADAALVVPRTRQSFFPVVDERMQVIGTVEASDIEDRAYRGEATTRIGDLMSGKFHFADEREPLWDVIERTREYPGPVCVLRDRRLVGLFGPEELARTTQDVRSGRNPAQSSSLPSESETPPLRRTASSVSGELWKGPLPRPLRDSSYPTGS